MKESELLTYTRVLLQKSGLLWWRVANGPSIYKVGKQIRFRKSPIAGFPDLAGLTKDGKFWALELKSAKGKVADHQYYWLTKIKDSNGISCVARSKDEVELFISALVEA